jgi:hypothetical protein
MKLKISKSKKKTNFQTNCRFAVFFIFTAHLLLLKAHFLGKPNAPLLVFATQPGGEKQVGLRWVFVKKIKAGLAIFTKEKNSWAGYLVDIK